MTDSNALAREEADIRRLQRMVDLALFYARVAPVDRWAAETLWLQVRTKALELFPGKDTTFDLIYQPRFRRVMEERFGLH